MAEFRHVLGLVRRHPWAIWPDAPEVAAIRAILEMRAAGRHLTKPDIDARLDAAAVTNGPRAGAAAGAGVAILPIYGVIMPKAGLFEDISGGTSIQSFQRNFRAAMGDPEVGAIVLDVDSPGGMVDLVTEMAAEIRAGRATKPVTAVANTVMASAAYWLASSATEIVASPSATVGAVGVYTVYEDESGAYEQAGIAPEVVSAGRYKADDLGFGPLSTEARAALQSRIDEMYGWFTNDVAKGRGVKAADVRAGYGEGRVLTAQRALAEGMVDRIDTFDNVVTGIARQLARQPRSAAALAGGVVFAGDVDDPADVQPEPPAPPIDQPSTFAFELELRRRRAVASR